MNTCRVALSGGTHPTQLVVKWTLICCIWSSVRPLDRSSRWLSCKRFLDAMHLLQGHACMRACREHRYSPPVPHAAAALPTQEQGQSSLTPICSPSSWPPCGKLPPAPVPQQGPSSSLSWLRFH